MGSLIERSKNFVKKVGKADIVKVFSLTSLSTLVRMCTGLISVKVVASIIGPAGVALVGQLNNFATIIMSFSSGGINSGITKYVAEYRKEESAITGYLSTALRITVICSLICAVLLIILNRWISELVMLSPDYGYVFTIFGITVLFYALNNMLTSIVNGYKEFRRFVYINIANSIVGVIFTVTLVLCWQLEGALIAAVTYQSVMLFITLWMLRRTPWLKWHRFKEKLSKAIAHRYLQYTLMTLTTALTVPVAQMLLRGYVIAEISPVEAGWWEGIQRISNMYLMVITTSFSVYYLPRLSEISYPQELRYEIFKAYKVVVPMLLGVFTILYFLRFFIIRLLFTPDFLPMSQLFIWQMGGDLFQMCSWLLSFLMVAKRMTMVYVSTQIIFSATWIGLGLLFVSSQGVVGICQAYLVNYIIYWMVMILIFRKLLFTKSTN